MDTEVDAIVIGAGPAGLAVAGCLSHQGAQAIVLEAENEVGARWRSHYDRLHLHTARDLSALPHVAWPSGVPTYPSRQHVVDYLERCAENVPDIRLGHRVTRVSEVDDGFEVAATSGARELTLRAASVVVASGYNRVPHRPRFAGEEVFAGEVVHSRAYRNGRAYLGKRALVVGAGNSGAEIALDLFEHGAVPSLLIRSPIHVMPRDFLGVPSQYSSLRLAKLPTKVADRAALAVSQLVYGDLRPHQIRRPKEGAITQMETRGRIPLVDVGTIELIRQKKITVVPSGIARFTERGIVCDNGDSHSFDLVVLATGYRAELAAFIVDAPPLLDARGYPRTHGASCPERPGLYFVGFRNPSTGALHDIAREAKRVAKSVAKTIATSGRRGEGARGRA